MSLFSVSAGTGNGTMYTLVFAQHVLNNDTAVTKDMYVSECQDPIVFDQELVRGNILVCCYSVRFVLGLSTINQAIETAGNLCAAGVIFYMDPYVTGYQINPVPMKLPGIIISSANNSKVKNPSNFDGTVIILVVCIILDAHELFFADFPPILQFDHSKK